MRHFIAIMGAALMLSACATTTNTAAPEPIVDVSTLAWAKEPGTNSITGDALLRTRGGEVRTCAGLDVKLVPAAPYTDSFVERVYGSAGYFPYEYVFQKRPEISPDAAPFVQVKRCNAQGQFAFSGLPDGAYYVIAIVTWEAPTGGRYSYMASQGGEIAQRVEVSGGQAENITLTR